MPAPITAVLQRFSLVRRTAGGGASSSACQPLSLLRSDAIGARRIAISDNLACAGSLAHPQEPNVFELKFDDLILTMLGLVPIMGARTTFSDHHNVEAETASSEQLLDIADRERDSVNDARWRKTVALE